MYFHIIASGSKGNATIISNGKTNILIDIGISKIRLTEGLNEIGLSIEDIDTVLITHDHTDHIKGIRYFSPRKIYGLEEVVPPLSNKIELFKKYKINEFSVTPIPTSHDASAGAGFVVALTGTIVTMPGLPKKPAAEHVDVDEKGRIKGLF